MKQNEKIGKFCVLIVAALLVTSVAVAVAVAQPAPYPGAGPTPTPGPTPAPGAGGPAPYPTPGPTPTPTPTPGTLPDLVVEDVDPVFGVGEVIVHFVIHNDGTARAGSSHATKYMYNSTGALVHVDHASVNALGPSGEFYGEFDPEPCPPSETFTVRVEADNYHVVAESNETNNNRTETFTCPAGPQPGGPDLEIQITQPVEKQVAGPNLCQYRVEWTATNIGNERAAANRVALFANGVKIDEEGCRALGSGASDSGNFWGTWWNCPPACGTPVNVEVRVDYFNVVAESNEDNNNDSTSVDCRVAGIQVIKEVFDPVAGVWVDEIDAEQGDIVQFRCTVENTGCCCDLDDITVTDVLSDSLRYNGAVPAPDREEYIVDGPTTLMWLEGILEPDDPPLVYNIWAEVIDCGVDTNTQTAVATDCTGEEVSDDDTATVNAPPEASLEAITEVWDGANWVNTIDVPVGDLPVNVRFRSRVHNDGTCCDLEAIEVRDLLSDERLVFTSAVNPFGIPPIIEVLPDRTRLYWYIPRTIEYCETIDFLVRANIAAGPAIGDVFRYRHYARAWSPRTDEFVVSNTDVARVRIVA